MRAHGVSNFPDPTYGRSGVQFGGPAVNPQSPAFQSAQQACRRYEPIKGPPTTHMSAGALRKAFTFARCMRSHGVPNFPDPTQNASPNNGGHVVLALGDMFFEPGPGMDPKSPAVQQAIARCGIRLPNGPSSQG